jgi:hypothetical protein
MIVPTIAQLLERVRFECVHNRTLVSSPILDSPFPRGVPSQQTYFAW